MKLTPQYRPKTTNPYAKWIDGTVPTTVTRSTTFQTRYVREDGKVSSYGTAVIKKKRKFDRKHYVEHFMATFAGTYNQPELLRELRHMKEKQHVTALWIHMEDKDLVVQQGNTLNNAQKVVAGCEIVGLPFAIGLKHGGRWGETWIALDMNLNSPMGLRDIDGRPVLFDYHLFAGGNYNNVVAQVESRSGWTMDDICYIPEVQFPAIMGNADTIVLAKKKDANGDDTDEDIPEWTAGNPYPIFAGFGAPQSKQMANIWYEHFPEIAGLLAWQGENVTVDGLIKNAKSMMEAAEESGRVSTIGWVLRYASNTGYTDIGLSGGLTFFQWLVSLHPDERPDMLVGLTANDLAESTPHNQLPHAWPFKGLGGLMPLPMPFGNGNKIRHPDVENTGVDEAFVPFIDCFLTDAEKPVFNQDRIFAKLLLHPAGVKPREKAPLMFVESDPKALEAFEYSMYKNPWQNGLEPVQVSLQHANNIAEMLIYSTSPVQGEIDGVKSAVMPAGVSVYSRDIGNKEGSIRMRSIVNGRQKVDGFAPQPRLDDILMGAGKPIIIELNPEGKTYPAAPKLKVGKDGNVTATVTSKLHIVYRLDHSKPKPYTGPVEIPEGLRAWFYTEETDKYNESPVALI